LAPTIEAAKKDAKKLADRNKQFTSPVSPGVINHTKTTSSSSPPTGSGFTPICYRCGGPHLAPQCWHKDTECRYCKKKGHLARVCKAKTHVSSRSLDPVSTQANQDKTKPSLSDDHSEPYQLDVHLNDFPMKMDWAQEQQCRSSTPLCLIISNSPLMSLLCSQLRASSKPTGIKTSRC